MRININKHIKLIKNTFIDKAFTNNLDETEAWRIKAPNNQTSDNTSVQLFHIVERYWEKIVKIKYLYAVGTLKTHEICTHH